MKGNRAIWTLLVLALVPAGRAMAQESVDPRWLPWLGCWQPVEDMVAEYGDAEARQAYFCVRPDGAGVEIATVVDDAPVSSRLMIADGARYEVSEEGCSGSQSAQWSADGRRLFVSSDVICEGGVTRSASGLMAMVSPAEWIDAHAVGMGEERMPRAIRYRPAPTSVAEAAGFDLQALRFGAVAEARRLAAAPVSTDDVIEAAANVDHMALEAFLFEREQGFELNADEILYLADNGVPENVIDLMVALSYPSRFSFDREQMAGEYLPEERPDRYASGYYGRDRYWDYCYGRGFYGSYCSPWGYMPLGWSYGYYNPYYYGGFRYGSGYYGYGWNWGYTRPVIVVNPGNTGFGGAGGRAVKGQGYTRSRGTASAGGSSSGRSSGATAGASRSGGSSGSASSSGRTAKRRGGGSSSASASVSRSSGSSMGRSTASSSSSGRASSGSSSSGRTAKRRGGGGL